MQGHTARPYGPSEVTSLLLAHGVHPLIVMEQLGRSQISLTMNTYSHVVPELHAPFSG